MKEHLPSYSKDRLTIRMLRIPEVLCGNWIIGEQLCPVNLENPRHMRALDNMGRYMQREFHYDFPLSIDDRFPTRAFFFFSRDSLQALTADQPVGVAVFARFPRPWEWEAQWIWMHPYARRHGLLTDAWPYFKKEFGEFRLQRPISPAMKGFLEKQKAAENSATSVAEVSTF
jgi:hypothetical protein